MLNLAKMLLALFGCIAIAAGLNGLLMRLFYSIKVSLQGAALAIAGGLMILIILVLWTQANWKVFWRWIEHTGMFLCALIFLSVLRFILNRSEFFITPVDILFSAGALFAFWIIRKNYARKTTRK